MPLYGSPGSPVAIYPGDLAFAMFNAEVVTNASKSVVMARAQREGTAASPTTFQSIWAATGILTIQGSNIDVDADYVTLYTGTALALDNYTDPVGWAFYRALSGSSGTLTVLVKR